MSIENMNALAAQVDKLSDQLDKRCGRYQLLDRYYDGENPLPVAVTEARVTKAYRRLMPIADAPWGSLIVGSVLDRLEVGGIRDKEGDADKLWDLWQQNHMDSESALAHCSGLISGRAFATVWPGDDGETPEISLDTSEQMIVQYEEGSRHRRRAALRKWRDADTNKTMVTLYLPDGIYKFVEAEGRRSDEAKWTPRQEPGDEDWPVANPWNVVPVVEIRFNPRLKSGQWGYARGEYEHCRGLIDRINLLTFIGLVVAFWQGFPVRAVIGDRILRDDDGNVIPPFDVRADTVVQFEDPQVKLATFDAADRDNLLIYPELSQLAAITKTPRHYFPLAQAMSNLSADAIRADEGALNAKVTYHKKSAGEGWLEINRLVALQAELTLSPSAELWWIDHESRSLAERADAAVKLNGILPWQALAEMVLDASQDTISRWEAMRASDALSQLVAAAKVPTNTNGSVGPTGNAVPTPPVPAG